MADRSRIRRGREILYTPTAAEATALGAGPWPGLITHVNVDGSCDLVVDVPGGDAVGAALASTLIAAPAAAAFTDPPSAAEMALLRTLVNELRTDVNTMATLVNTLRSAALGSGRKDSIAQGGGVGQFSLAAGPASV